MLTYSVLSSSGSALIPLIFRKTERGVESSPTLVKDFLASKTEEGNSTYGNSTFDLMTFRDYGTVYAEDDLGNKKELPTNERYYVPCEITWLLKTLNFKTVDIFGAKLGAFTRSDRLTTEDYEMLVIATL